VSKKGTNGTVKRAIWSIANDTEQQEEKQLHKLCCKWRIY